MREREREREREKERESAGNTAFIRAGGARILIRFYHYPFLLKTVDNPLLLIKERYIPQDHPKSPSSRKRSRPNHHHSATQLSASRSEKVSKKAGAAGRRGKATEEGSEKIRKRDREREREGGGRMEGR